MIPFFVVVMKTVVIIMMVSARAIKTIDKIGIEVAAASGRPPRPIASRST
ncbi:hypothetical protein [Nonomuraea solani]|nr:hypothetical protein [Nonomuraea solani]